MYEAYNTLLFLVLFLLVLVNASTVIVDSPFGTIQGIKKTEEKSGLSYLSFKGIPYAKPPVGDLRFAKPQPHPNIDGVFDATNDDLIACPQMDPTMSGMTEDCLILNVQRKDFTASDPLLKVIVYIHGGGFHVGTSTFQESKSFVTSHDVIVVTMNYRLGVLGFISTENEASPGNYGLWDQALAIKWVKDNIRAFGGDPDDITIAGESAGGASVGFQSISPHTKGLFTKAYPLSGAATSIFGQSVNAQSHALDVARFVGCWEYNNLSVIGVPESRQIMDCLRKASLSKIISYPTFDLTKTQFVPIVDGDFLPDTPAKLLQNDEYLDSIGFFDRSYLVSIVNNDRGLIDTFFRLTKSAIFGNNDMSTTEKELAFDTFLMNCKKLLMTRLGESAQRNEYIVGQIDEFYEKRYQKEHAVREIEHDLNFLIPSLDILIAASRRDSCRSYFMYFNHFPRFVKGPLKGVPHEADLAFWFDFDLNYVEQLVQAGIQPELFDDDDMEIKRMFSSIIAEFAQSGNPGDALKDILPSGWPKYDVKTSKYLNFNLKPWIGSFFEKEKLDFWFNTVPSLVRPVGSSLTVVVDSPFGSIQGAKKTDESTGQTYLSFNGIPYAKPPLGDLRFTKPQPHPTIDGVFDASQEKAISCPQPDLMTFSPTDFDEDCLILNIRTKDIAPSDDTLRKVIVFIHGGAFLIGSSAFYDSKSFVINQDVIVVTINYRLNVFGFLSMENEASPGNYGLWDQALAIKWVKDNIRAFGGDPYDITIAGESAGGMSVGFQSISPHTKGLFTKAYPQSGTASAVFARSVNAQSQALTIAKLAGCWDKDVDIKIGVEESKTVVDCLRKAPVSSITQYIQFDLSKTQFVPTVDGDFVPDIPAKLLKDEEYLESVGFFDRSYLIAINNNEHAIMEDYHQMTKYVIFSNEKMSEEEKESVYKKLLTDAKTLYMYSRLGEKNAADEDIVGKIDDFYHRRQPGDEVLIDMVTDLNFLVPSLDYLSAAPKHNSCSSYFLYFDHYPYFMKGSNKGSFHGIDLMYWFDLKVEHVEMLLKYGMVGEFAEEDFEMKRVFSSIIADFMKTGNPGVTLKNTILPSGWPKYEVTNSYYLNFNPKPYVSSFLEKDKQDLWMDTVPSSMKKDSHHVHSEL